MSGQESNTHLNYSHILIAQTIDKMSSEFACLLNLNVIQVLFSEMELSLGTTILMVMNFNVTLVFMY